MGIRDLLESVGIGRLRDDEDIGTDEYVTDDDEYVTDDDEDQKEPGSEDEIAEVRRNINRFQRFALQTLEFVIILYILFGHLVGITSMPNADMYPRIDSGDMLLYYRLDKNPSAQDIVVFEKNGTRYVGRVVAVGGDTVDITNEGSVKINGYSMIESNIFYETYPLEGFTKYPLRLDENECFILADQRKGTEDSRFFGPVKYKDIEGTVISVLRRSNL